MLAALLNLVGPDFAVFGIYALIVLFVVAAILQWPGNMTVPQVFGLKSITYWQAFRLFLICGILFGHFGR